MSSEAIRFCFVFNDQGQGKEFENVQDFKKFHWQSYGKKKKKKPDLQMLFLVIKCFLKLVFESDIIKI